LEMVVSQTICPSWPWTEILPMSASQIPTVTGVGHQCPTEIFPWGAFLDMPV
jgi:hypothetical protein